MSVAPSDDYIKATKLIESFGCFFEKLSNVSNNPNQSASRLSQFKKVLYDNIFSTEKLASASEDLCGKAMDSSKFISRASPVITISPLETSQKMEILPTSLSQSRSTSHANLQPMFVRAESRQIASQEGIYENTQDKASLNTEYLPVTSFLSQIKAATHSEMAKLFSLTSNYLYARGFSDHQQPIFTALCFSFFEKLLKDKAKDIQSGLSQSLSLKSIDEIETLDTKETEFSSFLRSFGQNMSESDIMKKFYENLSTSPKLSQSAISVFKQVITKTLQERQQDIPLKGDSFDWMNEIDGSIDPVFLQNLAQVFKCTLKFLILTNERLTEKVFFPERPDSPTSRSEANTLRKELTLFYDKSSRSVFILYPLKRPSEDEYDSNSLQKYKVKTTPLSHPKPPLNTDSLKSIKNLGVEFQNGSQTTLDTMTSPITSLGELENREKQSHNRNPSTRAQQLRKANTLNVHTSSLNDCSTSFTYPESAVVRPMTEKVIPPSPHSATKDVGQHRFRMNENEGDLTPKDKEPVPLRSNSYNTYRESPVVDDKTFNMMCDKAKYEAVDLSRHTSNPFPELHTQVLGQKFAREASSRPFFERSATQDYGSRNYSSENKLKNEYSSAKTYSMELNKGDYRHESSFVIKPSSLPVVLKSKFDRFNQTINQNNQELTNTTSRYLKKDSVDQPQNKGMNLGPILNAYQNIMSQTKEMSGFRPSVGMALRMDD